jgi:hypothetical protein
MERKLSMLQTHIQPTDHRAHMWLATLNGSWHERASWLYAVLVLAHWLEHLAQAYQVFVLHWPRPAAGGVLGLWSPLLVRSEVLHFTYAVLMFAGLVLLRPAYRGRGRFWWTLSLVVQSWHLVEHTLLQVQALTGQYWFGATVPTSILQLWVPRMELHLLYNALVFMPMAIAMYYHLYPQAAEPLPHCGCARASTLPLPGRTRATA